MGLWTKLHDDECDQDAKYKASAMLMSALSASALHLCSGQISDQIKMLEMLDNQFPSNRTTTSISALTQMYTKRFNATHYDMATYIDEFETLFAQLKRMGHKTRIPDSHEARWYWIVWEITLLSKAQYALCALRTRSCFGGRP